jgi:hypothetical protein
MQYPKDKDAARMRATQLLPAFRDNWLLKKHDGAADRDWETYEKGIFNHIKCVF